MTFLAKPSGGQLVVDVELVSWIYTRCTYLDCHVTIVAYMSVLLLATHRHDCSRGCSCFVQSPGKPYSSKRTTPELMQNAIGRCVRSINVPQTNRVEASKSITTDILASFNCSPVTRHTCLPERHSGNEKTSGKKREQFVCSRCSTS